MSKSAPFKQIDITRALKGAIAAGLQPVGCEVVDGKIRLILSSGALDSANSADRIMGFQ